MTLCSLTDEVEPNQGTNSIPSVSVGLDAFFQRTRIRIFRYFVSLPIEDNLRLRPLGGLWAPDVGGWGDDLALSRAEHCHS